MPGTAAHTFHRRSCSCLGLHTCLIAHAKTLGSGGILLEKEPDSSSAHFRLASCSLKQGSSLIRFIFQISLARRCSWQHRWSHVGSSERWCKILLKVGERAGLILTAACTVGTCADASPFIRVRSVLLHRWIDETSSDPESAKHGKFEFFLQNHNCSPETLQDLTSASCSLRHLMAYHGTTFLQTWKHHPVYVPTRSKIQIVDTSRCHYCTLHPCSGHNVGQCSNHLRGGPQQGRLR